ncbi:MAG: nitrogen regulation protein NR(II) [Burkholderiaceae bacterium]|jgi:two-component system nitrogen regulation sensor histidine kinase GlnL
MLTTAVVVADARQRLLYLNNAAQALLGGSPKILLGQPLAALFVMPDALQFFWEQVRADPFCGKRQLLELKPLHQAGLHVDVIASLANPGDGSIVLELREMDQQLRLDRESRLLDQTEANRELIRNLAHEIKNPLGGIRGAAQLLEDELATVILKEYTQVIIKESDRLQTLVDRLLLPHRKPSVRQRLSIHEVTERVCALVLAEHPQWLCIDRDYDASLPELDGDREQLIQAVLNIVRNAVEALQDGMTPAACITVRTRAVRNLLIHRQRQRLALDLQVIDNGPGIPEAIRDTLFLPLVSGREGGSGLGLTLAQTIVQQHHGQLQFDSRPGRTVFSVILPLNP